MIRKSVITLKKMVKSQGELGQWIDKPQTREVKCDVFSITQAEMTMAAAYGYTPTWMVKTEVANYKGEEEAVFEGKPYAIYRSQIYGNNISLYLQPETGANDGE